MAWSTPRTWVAGEIVTAAIMNVHVRDQFNAIGSAWTSWTPAWTAATSNPAIGNGTIVGNYIQAGKLIIFRIIITAGSTTTFGTGAYSFTYPVAPVVTANASTAGNIAGYYWVNGGVKPYGVIGVGNTSTTWRIVSTSADSFISDSFPTGKGTGDKINVSGTYEAA